MKYLLIDNLITCTNLQVTFTKNQWDQYRSGEKSLLDIEIENKFKINTATKKGLVAAASLIVTFSLMTLKANAAGIDNIDVLGNALLDTLRKAGYWVCLLMCAYELIKAAIKSVSGGSYNNSDYGRIIFKYLLIFSSLYFLPWLFDLVRGGF